MKHKDRLNALTGYYTLPFSGEDFDGDVIKLDAKSFNILFQNFHSNGSEWAFREKLIKYDKWFYNKPYKVTENWLKYIIEWLQKEKHRPTDEEKARVKVIVDKALNRGDGDG